MVVKVFVLGRPGCGKSVAARLIINIMRCRGWSAIRINDYEILLEMFQADIEHEKFRLTEYNGFAVIDFSVLDAALKELERKAQEYIHSAKYELILLEFARDDYSKALKQFDHDFLRDAYFLFIDADVETCIQRIHKRISYTYEMPLNLDNHFVSDKILRGYYFEDNRQYITSKLKIDFDINKWIECIDNIGSWEDFADKVCRFVDIIFSQEFDGRRS